MTLSTRPSVLVLGATGRFGAAAVQAFADAGWAVQAQARRAPAALPPGVQHLGIAIDDCAGLARAAQGCQAVVFAVNPPYTLWATQALPLLQHGLAVAERLGATFMLPGNVYNFGETMPPRLREDTAMQPTTRKGRIRVQMEAELEARAARGLRSIVIRAGDFYGAGSGSWLDLAIAKDLRGGKLVYPGPLDRPHAWAYLPDLAGAFVAAAVARDAMPPFARLHFEGHTLTGAELLTAVEHAAAAIGVVPPGEWKHGGMPWALIRAGGWIVPMWREIAEMAYLWRVPHALDGHAMRTALGPLRHTPVDVAMRQALVALGHGAAAAGGAPAAARS
jgi:nucleoside-diphosphate-sugar epimerase